MKQWRASCGASYADICLRVAIFIWTWFIPFLVHFSAISVDAAESGFEVIDKSSVPPSDSEEVKAAVSAQGEDGSLLVNFVQVSKDEVPSAEAVADISEAIVLSAEKRCDTNGITASLIPHGGK